MHQGAGEFPLRSRAPPLCHRQRSAFIIIIKDDDGRGSPEHKGSADCDTDEDGWNVCAHVFTTLTAVLFLHTHQMWRVFALQQHWKTKTILTEVNKARYWTSEDNSYYDTVNPALLMMKDYASNRNLTDWLQLIPVPFTRADWSVFDWYELGEELNETNQGGYFPSHSSCPRYTERSSLFHCFNLYYRPPGVNV